MTKKDYIALAEVAKKTRTEATVVGVPRGRKIDCTALDLFLEHLCYVLERDNPNFNKKLFLAACR